MELPKYSLIAAMDNNRVIGNDDKIPWQAKGEQALFRRITENSVVIMGRKTYETLKAPLVNRVNVVLTRSNEYIAPECKVFSDFEKALISVNQEFSEKQIFVIGGATLYQQTIENAEELHITRIHAFCEGNVYFPTYNNDLYNLKDIAWYHTNMQYTYYYYIRKK